MRALAVDWSGARSAGAQRGAIRVAEAVDGALSWVSAGFTRDEAVDEVLRRARPGTVVGFDFSFSFPRWFVEAVGAADGPGVWEVAAAQGECWLAACTPPFWGRAGRPRPATDPTRPAWRRTEAGPLRPKSTFQVGGAGSVGTGSVRGMPHLRRLRQAGVAVWPFDEAAPGEVVAAEVYPRWATGRVHKASADGRAGHLAALGSAVPSRWVGAITASEDAFDAACAAIAISRAEWAWPATDDIDRAEGRILPLSFGAR